MKSKIVQLDVDFIGGQSALTAQEEKALSEYFAKKKAASKQPKTRISKRSKANA